LANLIYGNALSLASTCVRHIMAVYLIMNMPDWLSVVLLGLIEGLTEFIPVSSTGHLLITEDLLHIKQSEMFNVVIQSGAALALIPVFWRRIISVITGLGEPANKDLVMKLGVAFFITAVGGVIMKKMGVSLDKKSLATIAWATLIGGFVIFAVEAFCKNRRMGTEVTWTLAVAFGLGQLIAIGFPGASRSGSTIMLAMALGLARPAATEFSFLLGVPTLFAAAGKELFDAFKDHTPHPEPWSLVALGFIVSAVSAHMVVKWLLGYVRSHTFNGFAVYRILLGVGLLAWIMTN